jgi:N-acetyl sugar amidotransferase
MKIIRRCTRCLYHSDIPGITFDEKGVCNYCHLHDELEEQYPTGEEGENHLKAVAKRIRRDGKGKEFDVVVGVSGGCDSTYTLWTAKRLGLRALAAHYDNGWNTDIAEQNMDAVLGKLSIPLARVKPNPRELDDVSRSFLLSGAQDFEAPTDIALATVLYRVAEQHGVKWIFNGHNFRTEGIAPLGWSYMDGRYIADVHSRYGTTAMKEYPNLWLSDFLDYTVVQGIKRFRPLYYMKHDKKIVKSMLSDLFGWQDYGGHHLESKITTFFISYILPRRLNVDIRLLGYSAQIRTGMMNRNEGLEKISAPHVLEGEIMEEILERFNMTEAGLTAALSLPVKTYRDFKSYKGTFERMRPVFWLLYRLGRVPYSFYSKYCLPEVR